MNISEISSRYTVRKLAEADTDVIYELEKGNPLFFQHCPPALTRESIQKDMDALPPKMTEADKYYIGFFEGEKLVAIMDLITNYPDSEMVFIGLFMMDISEQGQGIGSQIIHECCDFIRKNGFKFIRLGYAKGNPQSEAFWKKNGFVVTGVESDMGEYVAVGMKKEL